ncbi:conserved hypothetical protein [Ricinus communis]|uniref:Uncharacterized protein n=1 Tax=Ricinus communis TaxID=3988 RepID=B9S3Q2_RICCO|nr:conserved hypothetical protein [Ricinus communis]
MADGQSFEKVREVNEIQLVPNTFIGLPTTYKECFHNSPWLTLSTVRGSKSIIPSISIKHK